MACCSDKVVQWLGLALGNDTVVSSHLGLHFLVQVGSVVWCLALHVGHVLFVRKPNSLVEQHVCRARINLWLCYFLQHKNGKIQIF